MAEKFHARGAAFLAALLCAASTIGSAARGAEPLKVSNAWVRTPAPGQKVAGAYMDLLSSGAASLTGAASPAAERVEPHSTRLEEGVMKMRPVKSIALPAGKTVKLAPGGLHLMLVDLKQPLKEGDRVQLTLSIRGGDATTQVKVEVPVRAAPGAPKHHH